MMMIISLCGYVVLVVVVVVYSPSLFSAPRPNGILMALRRLQNPQDTEGTFQMVLGQLALTRGPYAGTGAIPIQSIVVNAFLSLNCSSET